MILFCSVDNRKMNVGVNQKRNKERERWSQHYSRGVNSAGRGGPRMGGMVTFLFISFDVNTHS